MIVHCDEEERKTQLERISELAKRDKETVFNNLLSCFNVENLWKEFEEMDGKKAVGIDGVTKWEYGKNLRENLINLVHKIHSLSYIPQPAVWGNLKSTLFVAA